VDVAEDRRTGGDCLRLVCRWQPAPIPDSPAPTTSTSKCSGEAVRNRIAAAYRRIGGGRRFSGGCTRCWLPAIIVTMTISARLNGAVDRLRPGQGRTPELDGLRGTAILLVLGAHMLAGVSPHDQAFVPGLPDFLPGGGLTGVQLFFVLSGYLITGILVRGFAKRGVRSLPGFYGRRARRLLPALYVICGVYGLVVLVEFTGLRQHLGANSILSAITYTSNLPVFTNDGWLGHTWSLAVEEQFYLVWPAVLFVCLRFYGVRLAVVVACILIAITATLRHVLPLSQGVVWTDFRWDALMIGALAALVPIRGGRWVGWLGLAVLIYFSVTKVTFQPDVYLVTAIAAAGILVSAHEHAWLRNPVLQLLGLVSYGLYLWHVFILRFGLPGPVALVLSLTAAFASYTIVELRILRWGSRHINEEPATPTAPQVETVQSGAVPGTVRKPEPQPVGGRPSP
jgi:peptidoglycan/LPS O-acetylase OafA/YrhL